MGSFCPVAGTRNPHRDCNFAERVAETVPKSLRHSCRSELTRQGISLDLLLRDFSSRGPVISADLCMSPCSPDFLFELTSAVRSSGVKSLRIPHPFGWGLSC